ncbi:MAG: lysophospholipid acyltransferase family protein [Acidobacteria bacterium]|nr:lysophospholipid acyltransferase family protein [Acidobacteriota bacterium]
MDNHDTFRKRVEYAAVWLMFRVLSVLPRRAAIGMTTVIVEVMAIFAHKARATVFTNFEIAFPESTREQRVSWWRECRRNLGRVIAEMSRFDRMSAADVQAIADLTVEGVSPFAYIRQRAGDRGAVWITAHLGNWEMAAFGVSALYEPLAYMARTIENLRVQDLIRRYRAAHGNSPIDKTNSLRPALKLLRAGGSVAILADVNTVGREGVFVPFFGKQACATIGPAVLAIRANAVLFPIFCVWDKSLGKYKLIYSEPFEPASTGDVESDILATTAALTRSIEDAIRQYPGQWLWTHKRWKEQPPGSPPVYG